MVAAGAHSSRMPRAATPRPQRDRSRRTVGGRASGDVCGGGGSGRDQPPLLGGCLSSDLL